MKLLLTLFVAALTTSGLCQKTTAADSSADCVTWWKEGETKVYSIVHEKTTERRGDAGTRLYFIYEARITVLDATDEDYTVKWVFHVPDSVNSGISRPIPAFEGLQMIYRITSMGSFIELINWEEVRDSYINMMKQSAPNGQDSILHAALNKTMLLYNTKESVQAALIQEIQLFHMPYGYRFTKKKTIAHTELSNPFGGGPLPALQSSELTQLDKEGDQFTLVTMQEVDKELQGIKGQLASLEIKDNCEYQINWSSGWIRYLYRIRTAGSAGTQQTDAYTFKLKE